ncbi:MAG: GAF domain-containing protein [Anaerolineales bacterium]|nr:GAF domain-containing protein [Anaerolineales bacterium]
MLKWFNDLRINAKLFAILALPLASLLYFSINGVIEKYFVAENMRQVETLAELSTRIGAAVHELQRERGRTALFLGGQETMSAAEMESQRALTDEKIEALQTALQEIEPGQYGAVLQSIVDEAQGLLEALPEKRAQVDDLQVSSADSFAYYTSVIDPLLSATSQIAVLGRESEVARQATTYQLLLQAKERAGRERAFLSEAFSANEFDANQFARFLSNSTEQDTYTALFLGSAADEQQAFYHSRMTGPEVDEAARMKTVALEAGPGVDLNANADLWFEAATGRINLMKEVEDRLASDLSNAAARIRQDALRSFWTFAALTVVSVTLALASGFFLSRSISNPLQSMEQAAAAMASGDLQQELSIASRDEIGALAVAFNQMASRLRDLIGSLEQRVNERTKALANVAEISTIASNIPDLQKMLETVVHLTQRRFGLYHAHVFTYHEDTQELQIVACGYKEGDEHEGTHGTASIPMEQEQSLVARAARTRQPVIVNDVRSDPGWLPNPLLPDTASELAVPLLVGDKLIGVMDVQSDRVNAFTESDADIQMTLGAQVAVATQNIESTEIVAKRAAELQTVAKISTSAATIDDVQKMLETVVHLTQREFGLYHAHVFTFNEGTQDLQIRACGYKEGDEHEGTHGAAIIPLEQEQSLVARAARTRQAVIVNDVRSDPGWLPNPLLPDTASEMAVPMIVGDQVLGVLDVQSERLNAFTDEDASIQTTLASQVATALQNARQYQQTIRTTAELAGFQSAVNEAAIVAITDVGGRIEHVNDKFIEISKYSRDELIGQDHRILNSGHHSKEFIRDLWVTIANGKVWRNEIFNKAKDGSHYWVDTTIAPILNEQGKPVKYVAVRFDITHRKQAEKAIVQRAGELETVARVSSAAATILETDKLLLEVVKLTKEQFGLYHAHIYLMNEAGDTLVLAAGAGEPGRQMVANGLSIPLNREQSLVARAARERQGTIVNDVTQAPDFLANPLLPDTRSELAVPLIVGNSVLGVFDVQSDQLDHFTPEDVNIQSTLASQIAVALQNARTFTQAQKQAERESALNTISQKIQSATTVEAVLQIAARELGHALGAPMTIAQLSMKDK